MGGPPSSVTGPTSDAGPLAKPTAVALALTPSGKCSSRYRCSALLELTVVVRRFRGLFEGLPPAARVLPCDVTSIAHAPSSPTLTLHVTFVTPSISSGVLLPPSSWPPTRAANPVGGGGTTCPIESSTAPMSVPSPVG